MIKIYVLQYQMFQMKYFFEDDILGPVNTIDNKMYKKSKGIFFKKGIIKKIKTSKIFDIKNILYEKTDFLNIDAEGSGL